MFLQTWYYMNNCEWLLTIRLMEELWHAQLCRSGRCLERRMHDTDFACTKFV